ncbi:MAG: efflux transporter outer membrane subunit [Novosphingobium sp.]|nr:efflux transporter outer membrane subunit [Novosphingobium sp.]
MQSRVSADPCAAGSSWRVAATLALAATLAGCVSLAPDRQVQQVDSRLPEGYESADVSGDYRPAAWWAAFEDPVLDSIVERALAENLDIAEAAARVERANAQARVSRAALLPSLDAQAGASYSDSSLAGTAFGGLFGGSGRLRNESYSLGLGAGYELDLFGRARNGLLASRADARAAQHDFRAVQLAAAGSVIATYFEIVDARRQIELTVLRSQVLADRANRTEERFRRGLVDSFELYQVRQELRNLQSSLPQRESALEAAEGRLALLLRDLPEDLRTRIDGPMRPRLVFDAVPAGLPADLLDQRPDVAAARERLEAARLTIGARRAERFPTLRLNGSLSSQGRELSDPFDPGQNWALSLAANVVAPLFDGGRISANIAAARATYDERAAAYARTVLDAYREVTTAIEEYEEQRQRYRLIMAQLSEVESSLDLQARRFEAGVGSYIAYLDARRAVYQVRSSLSGAGRDVALARLGVHRALGGDWAGNVSLTPVNAKAAAGERRE